MSIGISNTQKNLSFSGLQAKGLAGKGKRMMKYIELTPGSPVSDAFVKEMSTGIESVDGRVLKQIITGQDLKFNLAQKYTDISPDLKGVTPRGWPKGTTWDNVASGSENGKIILCEKPIDQPLPTVSTIRHEIGHELHKLFKKVTGFDFINTESYTQTYLKDIKNLPENMQKYGNRVEDSQFYMNYVTQGSTPKKAIERGKREAFAEIFAKLNGGSDQETFSKGMDELYQKVFPNTVAYVEKLLYLLGKR